MWWTGSWGREKLLETEEKEYFRRLMRRLARFTRIEVITWTCLDNHWYILPPPEVEAAGVAGGDPKEVFLERMKRAFSPERFIKRLDR